MAEAATSPLSLSFPKRGLRLEVRTGRARAARPTVRRDHPRASGWEQEKGMDGRDARRRRRLPAEVESPSMFLLVLQLKRAAAPPVL